MTTTFEYAKPNDNYSNLSQVTLSQGLKFKKSQNKIKQRGKKNIIESFQSNLEEGQSAEAIAKTNQLIYKNNLIAFLNNIIKPTHPYYLLHKIILVNLTPVILPGYYQT